MQRLRRVCALLIPKSLASVPASGHGRFSPSLLASRSLFDERIRGQIQSRFSTSVASPESSTTETATPSDVVSPAHGILKDRVVPLFNFRREDCGSITLPGDIFDVPIRPDIVHRVVRWQLAKRRQGTHSTKTVSEVSGTGRKPWSQKGTGRARAGSLRAPQFRGGATMHGPKPRSHAHDLPKRVRRLGLKVALAARAAEGKLLVYEDLEPPSHKTKDFASHLQQLEGSKKFLMVDSGFDVNDQLKLAAGNLFYVDVLPARGLNVYSILQHDTLIMSKPAVQSIIERLRRPINR